jgi:hypothetical protein
VDGGVTSLTLSTATLVSCSAFGYNGDTSVAIAGTGIKPFTAVLHNASECHQQDVRASYVLVP